MKILGGSPRTRVSTASLFAVAAVISLAVVSCGGYGGGGGYMTAATPGPGVFNLSMPANGASGVGATPTLTWTASLYATSYTVEVSTSNTFSPLAISPAPTVATTTYPVTPPLAAGTYFWRVIANNAYGMYTSPTFTFAT